MKRVGKTVAGFCALCLLPVSLLLSSCTSVSEPGAGMEVVDLSGGNSFSGVLEQRKIPKGIQYSGFLIPAMPDSDWVAPMRFQSARKAVWGLGDPKNRLHTVIAEVKISDLLSPEAVKHFSVSKLKQAMRQSLSRSSRRVKMESFDVWSGERCGCRSVEYKAESVDTGSRHSKARMKLFMRGFVVLTGEKRMLSAVVSERTDDPEASQNLDAAEHFLERIRFPEGEESSGEEKNPSMIFEQRKRK